ncbi:MAG: MBL fold metallo-hydrolase, partial [Muribaculaceae bacterium]|nr:MBL fold metallo-hydrolase [Muribaculaceae bacterium]
KMLCSCDLPEDFDVNGYEIFRGKPSKILSDGDIIDIGGRAVTVLHTPGHSPGHMCFFEKERGYLFTGDLVYLGTLFAYYPSTDPEAYLASLEKIAALPAEKIFPGHHSLDISPDIVAEMRDEFRKLKAEGKLRHGGGTFDFGKWAARF